MNKITKKELEMAWNFYDHVWERWRGGEVSEEVVERVLNDTMAFQDRYTQQELEETEKRAELHKGDN